MKVVINVCYGGYSLSEAAFDMLLNRKGVAYEKRVDPAWSSLIGAEYYNAGHVGEDLHYLSMRQFTDDRSDVDLVAVVEELGSAANGDHAKLVIVEIPDDVKWHIDEYDGMECVAENHRTWGRNGEF